MVHMGPPPNVIHFNAAISACEASGYWEGALGRGNTNLETVHFLTTEYGSDLGCHKMDGHDISDRTHRLMTLFVLLRGALVYHGISMQLFGCSESREREGEGGGRERERVRERESE